MEAESLLNRSRYPQGARVHLIAVGGSVMHNLALALHRAGCRVSGSDDVIRNPAKDRLAAASLLPPVEGWFPDRITTDLDAVVLGMHARADNPELRRAQELNLPIYSFPQLVLQLARNQQRVAVAGSHGKTTITALLMHVMRKSGLPFDYLVGAAVPGFEHSLQIGTDAPVIILEGDEYPASAIDLRPKALVYEPHLLVLTGVSWDHVNVYPSEDSYLEAFTQLLSQLNKAGVCVYNKEDRRVREIVQRCLDKELHEALPYTTPHAKTTRSGRMEVKLDGHRVETLLIGKHNAANIAAAWQVCQQFSIQMPQFAEALSDFQGAGLRLETWRSDDRWTLLRDFAHSPSKVAATVDAVADHWRDRPLVAVLELHTYSSLSPDFLSQYRNTLRKAKHRILYVGKDVLERKGGQPISEAMLSKAFHEKNLSVAYDRASLLDAVRSKLGSHGTLLLMSSGTLAQIDRASWEELLP